MASKLDVLCHFSKPFIYVNKDDDLKYFDAYQDEFDFYIMNPNQDVVKILNDRQLSIQEIVEMEKNGSNLSDVTRIHINIPFGKGKHSFVESQETHIVVNCGDLQSSEWSPIDDVLECILASTKTTSLNQYQNICISFTNIKSLAAAGITYFDVEFKNFLGLKKLVKRYQLEKREVEPKINYFIPTTPVNGLNQQVHITWSTSSVKEGRISPGDFSITKGYAEYVQPITQFMNYHLEVHNDSKSLSCETPVYISPPTIRSFERNTQDGKNELTWEMLYGMNVKFNQQDVPAKEDAYSISNDMESGTLSAEGYLYKIERTIYFPKDYPELRRLEKTLLYFENYTVVQVLWETEDVKTIELCTMEDIQSVIEKDKKGNWESVYNKELPVISLNVENNDGKQFSFTLS